MSAVWHQLREIGNACWFVVSLWALFRYARGWRLEWRPPRKKHSPSTHSSAEEPS